MGTNHTLNLGCNPQTSKRTINVQISDSLKPFQVLVLQELEDVVMDGFGQGGERHDELQFWLRSELLNATKAKCKGEMNLVIMFARVFVLNS